MNRPNDPKVVHETVLKDIMDLWDSLKSWKDENKRAKGPMKSASSLAKVSSNLTLVFPVICSRGISIDRASMISKAVEKNAVTMLQRVFAAWQAVEADGRVNFQDYLAQFHTNLSTRAASLDDLFEFSDRYSGAHHESSEDRHAYERAIREDMRNLNYTLPSSINESSLNRFVVKEGAVNVGTRTNRSKDTDENNQAAFNPYADKKLTAEERERLERENSRFNYGAKKAKETLKLGKDATDYFKAQVSDADYKKANELMPTPMTVAMRVQDTNGHISDPIVAMIGVKAKLYPIGSEDIVKHVAQKSKDGNWIINFFRASTREISFMKDFVLAIDKAKIDAMSLSARQSTSDKMWKVLERRATISRLKRAMRDNNAGAITTLCVSQEEVEVLRKESNVDLERISTVLGLFEAYNLMCICIVDESLEVAKFIFDESDPSWETISFTHLERESSDNTYKRVVNLMTKMR